jgi:predicted lipoprotein with Yx(FWY)xxD motif
MAHRASASLAATALAAAALAAGCGGNSGSSTSESPTTGSGGAGGGSPAATGALTVKSASSSLGTILVDGQGRTLYLFERDRGPRSTCTGACTEQWPPATTSGSPRASGSASAGKVSTSRRSDGTTQVVYANHPLYYYIADAAAGDTNGQGINAFGALWYVLGPSGAAVTSGGSSGGTGY